jgi:general nucleoside transport system ATP-binding protein
MRITLQNISKQFGSLRANDDISLAMDGGSIYAILGENGAGKSTLMKILSGYQPPTSGQIQIEGRAVTFATPADALRQGIGMLHQEPLDVPPLSVLDNFLLERPGGFVLNRKQARAELLQLAERFGFAVRPDALIERLTIGERQQLEIMRLLSLGARFLILDEPTTGISAEQKAQLFQTLRTLAARDGLTVALVSHKLEDVEALCDHVFVLRSGRVVGDAAMPISTGEMVQMMFGKRIDPETRAQPQTRPNTVLHANSVTVRDERLTVADISLTVRAGQVVGLAGLDGSGQRAFLRACAGLDRALHGQILLDNEDVTHLHYHTLMQKGVAFASAGRLEEGLIKGLTITEHFALAAADGWQIDKRRATAQAADQIAAYTVKGTPDNRIEQLSGGNQQRVVLSLLPDTLKLLLLENPMRGLDVESARWIWSKLLERRASGTAIIFTSPDLDEIRQYSDTIAIFSGGRVTVIEGATTVTAGELGQLIGGKTL